MRSRAPTVTPCCSSRCQQDLLDFAEDNSDEDGSEAGSDGGDASEEMNDEAHGEASVEDEEESSAAVEELPPRRHAVVLTTQRVREWTSLLKVRSARVLSEAAVPDPVTIRCLTSQSYGYED